MLTVRAMVERNNESTTQNVSPTQTESVSDISHLSHMLQFEWRIEPHRLQICKHPDDTNWRLGRGAYGLVRQHAMQTLIFMVLASLLWMSAAGIALSIDWFPCIATLPCSKRRILADTMHAPIWQPIFNLARRLVS